MRGKAALRCMGQDGTGITPAYAGKSGFSAFNVTPNRDHPRVCGEKQLLLSVWQHLKGSPPRMRGKGGGGNFPKHKVRITPAYAGKSWACPMKKGTR